MIREIKGLYGAWRKSSPENKEMVKNCVKESLKEGLRELAVCGALCIGTYSFLGGIGFAAIHSSSQYQPKTWLLSEDGNVATRSEGGLIRIIDSDGDSDADFREVFAGR